MDSLQRATKLKGLRKIILHVPPAFSCVLFNTIYDTCLFNIFPLKTERT